ncbi:hypothetical protein BGW38_001733 [Lunasporangiospora selenospora]|uniref:hydroxymethylglutaryl-CoA reductase (NADPH) n=1 Tax=Lunasporangiospora selenospora TaxID=979761 RepID=A0A9P6FV65_9FUNG|nr:hypothetical protein BGW38_001733 [Lunasporangiospora selenospora]
MTLPPNLPPPPPHPAQPIQSNGHLLTHSLPTPNVNSDHPMHPSIATTLTGTKNGVASPLDNGHSIPLTINTSTASPLEGTRTHAYWSGFYKKTIKERRTQIGLAFPHLTRPSSLESFASSVQTSTKTSGQSSPHMGVVRTLGSSMAMTSAVAPTPITPITIATLTVPEDARSITAGPQAKARASLLSASFTAEDSLCDGHHPSTRTNRVLHPSGAETKVVSRDPDTIVAEASRPCARGSLLDFSDGNTSDQGSEQILSHVDHCSGPASSPQLKRKLSKSLNPQERSALERELAQGTADEPITEEERREQFERERKPTTISNLVEQRKMIGSPNGHLLEGDLSLDARLDAVLAIEQEGAPFPVNGLDELIANNMIENCIGTLGLPLGLAFNFSINGSPFVIPMAIEEPSVVAAVSSAAKTIASYQGFRAWAPERNMIIAQVQLLDILDSEMDQALTQMRDRALEIQEEANQFCPNMVQRGGGVQKVTFHRIRRRRDRTSFKGQDLLIKHGVIAASTLPDRQPFMKPTTSVEAVNTARCSEWLVVHLHIDVGDAMGANCANTVAEGIAPFLAKLSGGRVGVRILSNLNVDRVAKSTFRLPFSHMGYKSLPGWEVAVRMLEAYEWADLDPYRAATHNKGIMNGIDAVALATGQDWRAVEAGAHAWASGAGTYSERSHEVTTASSSTNGHLSDENGSCERRGSRKRKLSISNQERIYRGDAYKPLTRYWVEEDEELLQKGCKGRDALVFCGELEMPIMVGTKGGVLSTNPVHAFTLGIMRYPDSKDLAMAMVTVGLAQNFAAVRALVTEGIQRGHMALHARNIAISAGTPPASVDEVTAHMIDTGKIRLGAARSYLMSRGIVQPTPLGLSGASARGQSPVENDTKQ